MARGTAVDILDGLSSAVAIKGPCKVAAVANVTLSGEQTIDGVLTSESRVLVTAQTDARENGIYVTSSGDWRRAADFSRNNDVKKGTQVRVTDGGSYAQTVWVVTAADPVIDTDNITIARDTGLTSDALQIANNLSDLASKIAGWDNLATMFTSGVTATPAAGVLDLSAATDVAVTVGAGNITSITLGANKMRLLRFAGAGTITFGANLEGNTAAASYTTAAGDFAILTVSSTGVKRLTIFAKSGAPIGTVPVASGGTGSTTAAAALVALGAAAALQLPVPSNFALVASVTGNALTVALKGVDGNDPSASNPVYVPFRNATAATGTPSYLAITSALSLVISNGSTMGFTSAVAGRLWIVIFNDGGTARLGLVNCRSGVNIMSLRPGIASSTAEGGAGGADSAQVIYTGTAVTSKAMTVLGYLEATEATAGTWATTPSLIKLWQPGDPLPGDVVQIRRNDTGAVATGTTAIPNDDTIPQSGEGDQYMSQAITPTSATNVLNVKALATLANSANTLLQTALFQDATANALATTRMHPDGTNSMQAVATDYSLLAATTSATTFKIRGGSVSGTTTFNGSGGARKYGGVINSFMEVREVMA